MPALNLAPKPPRKASQSKLLTKLIKISLILRQKNRLQLVKQKANLILQGLAVRGLTPAAAPAPAPTATPGPAPVPAPVQTQMLMQMLAQVKIQVQPVQQVQQIR